MFFKEKILDMTKLMQSPENQLKSPNEIFGMLLISLYTFRARRRINHFPRSCHDGFRLTTRWRNSKQIVNKNQKLVEINYQIQ